MSMEMGMIPVVLEPLLCSRRRCAKSTCLACVEACPTAAVRPSDSNGVEFISACDGCGGCVSACPNGAIQMKGLGAVGTGFSPLWATDREWAGRLASDESPVIRFSCAHAEVDGPNIHSLTCLGRLTESLLIEAIRSGARSVEILRPECDRCPRGRAGRILDRVLWRARSILYALSMNEDLIRVAAVSYRDVPPTAAAPAQSRRAFLSGAVKTAAGAAVSVLPVSPTPAAPEEPFREKLLRRRVDPKREHLLALLAAMTGNRTDRVSAQLPIEIADTCLGCNVCETLCPTGAIRREETEASFALFLNPSACTACGVCAEACYPGAVKMREGIASAFLMAKETKLFDSPRKACKACGDRFLSKGAEQPFCPLCLDQERRRAAMARRWVLGEGKQYGIRI